MKKDKKNGNGNVRGRHTEYSNKIGLFHNNTFVNRISDVVLSFPFKDCILEGGMTREGSDERMEERFFCESIDKYEINALKDRKVLTNFSVIDYKSERKINKNSKDVEFFDKNGELNNNLLIKGNNLLTLYSLKNTFGEKIKMIYIDPPYNTGGDASIFTYNNNFNHSTWLTFMKNRLEVARDLLRDDGFIAITIDHYELFYLGVLADEIFGRDNRLGVITVVNRPQGRQFADFFSTTNEFMMVYSKNKNRATFNEVVLETDAVKNEYKRNDQKGKFKSEPLMYSRFVEEKMQKNPDQYFYPIYVSKDLSKITLSRMRGYYEVLPINRKRKICWKIKKDSLAKKLVNVHEYFAEKDDAGNVQIYEKYREGRGTKIKTHWEGSRYNSTENGTELLKRVLGYKSDFSYPKSLYAVLDILKLTTKEDDVILDFFAGSGTTGHATLDLNAQDGGSRKFILCEQIDEHFDICKERLKKVLQESGTLFSDTSKEKIIGFELKQYNLLFENKINSAGTKKELEDVYKDMRKNAFLQFWFDKKEFEEGGYKTKNVQEQKKSLLSVLDKNHLYLNYPEMEDEAHRVSKTDKDLTHKFYADN